MRNSQKYWDLRLLCACTEVLVVLVCMPTEVDWCWVVVMGAAGWWRVLTGGSRWLVGGWVMGACVLWRVAGAPKL